MQSLNKKEARIRIIHLAYRVSSLDTHTTVPPPGIVGGSLLWGRMFFLKARIPGVPTTYKEEGNEEKEERKMLMRYKE